MAERLTQTESQRESAGSSPTRRVFQPRNSLHLADQKLDEKKKFKNFLLSLSSSNKILAEVFRFEVKYISPEIRTYFGTG